MQYYQENIALGSRTGLTLVSSGSASDINSVYHELWKDIFRFERRFSRFIPDSELSMFNKNAGTRQFISPEFKKLLETSVALAKLTNNLYNPFILPALQAAGYKHSRVPGFEKDEVDDHSQKAVTTIDKLKVGEDWAVIPYGTAIDLGGCGKGYLADMLARKLPDFVTGYWLSFGGDIAAGGLDNNSLPWHVTVESAIDEKQSISTIVAEAKCGIATSGTIVHGGKQAGNKWHHIIDPRTKQPAKTDVLLATVHHTSTVVADVLASCAVILGSSEAMHFLKKYKAKTAIIQYIGKNGKIENIQYGDTLIPGVVYA